VQPDSSLRRHRVFSGTPVSHGGTLHAVTKLKTGQLSVPMSAAMAGRPPFHITVEWQHAKERLLKDGRSRFTIDADMGFRNVGAVVDLECNTNTPFESLRAHESRTSVTITLRAVVTPREEIPGSCPPTPRVTKSVVLQRPVGKRQLLDSGAQELEGPPEEDSGGHPMIREFYEGVLL